MSNTFAELEYLMTSEEIEAAEWRANVPTAEWAKMLAEYRQHAAKRNRPKRGLSERVAQQV